MKLLNKWVPKATWGCLATLENLGEYLVFPWDGMPPRMRKIAMAAMPTPTKIHLIKSFRQKDLTAWKKWLSSVTNKSNGYPGDQNATF